MKKSWRTRVAGAVAALLLVLLVPLVVALVYLKLHESQLVFQSQLSHQWSGLPAATPAAVQAVQIAIPGGRLAAYTQRHTGAAQSGYWILHLHGNADSAFSATQMRNVARLGEQGFNVLAFDYRGFGGSPGKPSEQGIYEDAENAWQWLIAQGIPPQHIIIWGHSLGSGPAVKLATEHRAAALVLFGAFTSIPDAAADQYPWLPVRLVAGIHFDSLQRMPRVQMPVVIAHSPTDRVILMRHARRLLAAAPEPKALLTLHTQHDDGLGGHVTALYDRMDLLLPLLRDVAGVEVSPAATAAPPAMP